MKFWSFFQLFLLFVITQKFFFIFFFFNEDDNFSGSNNFGSVESLPENSVLFDDDLDLEINFDQHHQNTNHDDHSLSQRNFCFTNSAYLRSPPLAPYKLLSLPN